MRVGKINRYYSGVRKRRTTICCSALALTCVWTTLISAQAPGAKPSLGPFRLLWTVPLEGTLAAAPAFSGQRGFFPLDAARLVAYDLSDGKPLWTSSRSMAMPPATGAGLVFLAEPNRLLALNEADGTLVWQRPFDETLAAPLVWDNGWLIAAGESGSILALRGADGAQIWRFEDGVKANARPALAADRVYVPASNDRVLALQVEDGTVLWERRLGGAPNDILALDDRLYVGSDDNYFYCLKADTGEIDWRWSTGADVVGPAIADDDFVYFASKDNVLRALDRGSGNQRWKRPLPLRPLNGPVRSGETLIVSGIAPTVRAFLMRDGAPAGEVAAEGELAAPPYVLPETEAPTVVVVSRHLEKGEILKAFTRAAPPAPPAPPPPAPNPPALPPPAPPPPDPNLPVPNPPSAAPPPQR
jgi:outer membrane protein assembly factor BamB